MLPMGTLGTNWNSGLLLGASGAMELPGLGLPLKPVLSAGYFSLGHKTFTADTFAFIPIQLSGRYALDMPDSPINCYGEIGGGVALETLTVSGAASSAMDGIGHAAVGGLYSLGSFSAFLEVTYNMLFSATTTSSLLGVSVGLRF